MGRFLFGVVVAALLFWGYGRWFDGADAGADAGASAVQAAADRTADPAEVDLLDPKDALRDVDADDGAAPAAAAPDAAGAAQRRALDASPPDAVTAWIRSFQDGDRVAQSRAFAMLLELGGRDRERLSAALMDRVKSARAPDDLLRLLGPTNAFLHCDEGRRVAALALRRIREQPKPDAISGTNRLLAASMRGPIGASDRDARALVDAIYDDHRRLVRQVVFDPSNRARAKRYEVQAGDSLSGIAAHFRRTLGIRLESGTLAAVNRITNPNALQVGQVLRIPVEPIRCEVQKDSFLMAVYLGDTIVRVYWISHGKDGHDTPETTFTVGEKIEKPDWHFEGRVIPYGSPENPLGSHFVQFRHESFTGFGVHGTDEPESIGTRASRGCIRLGPDDILDFVRLVPRGSEVVIR